MVVMVKIIIKKPFMNPYNLKRKAKIIRKVNSITIRDDEITIEVEGMEPLTKGEKNAILAFINTQRWEIVEET